MQISVLRTWGDTNEISGASTVFYSNQLQACAIVNTVNALPHRLTVAFIYGLNGVAPLCHSRTPPPIGRPMRETTEHWIGEGEGDIENHDSTNNNSNNNNNNDSNNNSVARN